MIIFLRNNVKDNKKVLLLHRRSEKKYSLCVIKGEHKCLMYIVTKTLINFSLLMSKIIKKVLFLHRLMKNLLDKVRVGKYLLL
jgi:hypothetical protein